jgi:hypothetical protein
MKKYCASSWLFTKTVSIIKENLENIFKTSAANVDFDYEKLIADKKYKSFD